MASTDRPQLVQALFTFKATNNDELTFKKGDVITLTQRDDADWWEGTLGDTTGWFPANYVKECSAAGESRTRRQGLGVHRAPGLPLALFEGEGYGRSVQWCLWLCAGQTNVSRKRNPS